MDLIQVGTVDVEAQLLHSARSCIIGLKVRLDGRNKHPVVKAVHGGQIVIELPSLSEKLNAANTPLIYHLATLTNAVKVIQFEGRIEEINNGIATLCFDVLFPEWIFDGHRSFSKSQSIAHLLLHMKPLPDSTLPKIHQDNDGNEEEEEELIFDAEPAETRKLSYKDALKLAAGLPQDHPTTENGPEVYSLRNVIMAIPTTKETPPTYNFKSRNEDLATPSLADLHGEEEILEMIMSKLPSESLQAIACTCKFLRDLAAEIPPDLKLELFLHQRDAQRWMLQRELPPKPIPHPTIRRFTTSNGKNLWGNTATGEVKNVPPPQQLYDFRGGFFSDEPGLGKTITILGLILRTKGAVPDAPVGVKMTWFRSVDTSASRGRKFGYYTISREDATGLSKLQRTKSTGVVRRSPRQQQRNRGNYSIISVEDSDDAVEMAKNEERGEEEDAGEGLLEATAVKRQRLNKAGASVATTTLLYRGGSSKRTSTECDEEEMVIDLTTPPPKASELAAPGSADTSSGGHGTVAACDEHVNNQWGRQIRRHINFTSSEDEQQEQKNQNEIEEAMSDDGEYENENASSDNSSKDDGDYDDDDDDRSWLQCDLCYKWRRVPLSHHPQDENEPWCCYQHPLAGWRKCSIAGDEVQTDEHLTECPGWKAVDSPNSRQKELEDNVDFYRSLLDKYNQKINFYNSQRRPTAAMNFLMKSNPGIIAQIGFAFSTEVAKDFGTGFGQFLIDIGFKPAHGDKLRSFGLPAQKKIFSGAGDSLDWIRWKQPDTHHKLVFDNEALKKAMDQGPKPKGHRIFLSPATLIVVPTELIQHWIDQISRHTQPGTLRVAVYETKGNPMNSFKETPDPQILAWEYDVIITTFNKMSTEWKTDRPLECSPLAQVHWLRIILDEGHTIGNSLNVTSKLQMATSLRAERRWVMTGTPAPSTTPTGTIALKYMQPLLSFLHEESLGSSTGFSEAVDKQIKECPIACRWRLQSVLKRCLIRASKADILPPLKRVIKLVDFTPSHAQSYNDFIGIGKANTLLCDFFDPDHTQSLLSPTPESVRRMTQYLKNVAQACNVAGNINLHTSSEDIHSCLEIIAANNGFTPPSDLAFGGPFCGGNHPLRLVEESITYGGTCACCSDYYRHIMPTPCACILCVYCAGTKRTKCPSCSTPYVMQSVNDPARKRDEKGELNPNPKWDVPQELIELQPAFAQRGAIGEGEGSWQEDWQITNSSKIDYTTRKLREYHCLPPPEWSPDDWGGNVSIWPPVEDFPENENEMTTTTAIAGKKTESGQLLQHQLLLKKRRKQKLGVPKAIIYTQHPIHGRLLINRIKDSHPEGCVETFHRNMTQHDKAAALNRFKNSPLCRVLIMDESGSHGLDLSYVRYVFIMEPIANKSLEEQVVSRAHRLGQQEDVVVEILAMRGSYEEAILRENREECCKNKEEIGEEDKEDIKIKIEGSNEDAEEEGDDGASGSSSGGGGSGPAKETDRQKEAKRMERNAYLLGLKPVRVGK